MEYYESTKAIFKHISPLLLNNKLKEKSKITLLVQIGMLCDGNGLIISEILHWNLDKTIV
jgi:hypothetical protein